MSGKKESREREKEEGARSRKVDEGKMVFPSRWLFTELVEDDLEEDLSHVFPFLSQPASVLVSLRDPFSSSSPLSRSISLFNFHDRATRFHRESSSFPLPPSSRLALCNEKCARNRYFLLPLHPCFSSFCVYSVWKKKLREKFRGRISQDGKPLFKYEQESDLVFNSSN